MSLTKKLIILSTFFAGLAMSSDMRESAIEERTKPMGSICLKGDGCGISSAGPGYKVNPLAAMTDAPVEVSSNKIALSEGPVHEVKMLNSGADGIMVFEPAVIKISKGDTVNFVATDMSHNSASLDGMIPAGADSWNGALSQDISITFTEEGVYVYQCTPHLVMAMVGLIQVGEATNMAEIKANLGGFEALIALNQDRLGKYFSQLESL